MNGIQPESKELIMPLTSGRRVSWGAIWAGMFVTVIMELMFILLGVIVGIKTLNPSSTMASVDGGMSLGAMIWLMCSWLVAVWVGARVAGWMSGGPRRTDGVMHGMVVWSFSAAVILLFLTGALGIFGAGGGGMGGEPSGGISLNSGAGQQHQQEALAPSTGGNTRGSAMGGVGGNAGTSGGGGGNVTNQPNWGKALWTFVALILGLGVACAGGATGASALYEDDRTALPLA